MQIRKKIQTLCIKLRVDRCIAWMLCAAMIGSMMNLALPVLAANNADSENAADSENTVDSESNADSENTVGSENPADSESNADSENAADSESNADTENTVGSENTADSENSVESEGTYCEHHTEHTEECGYVEAVEGQPCTHTHDEQCGNSEGTECSHEHDENCGYVEAVEGQPCRFVCEICGGGSEEAAEEEPGEDSEQSVNVLAAEPAALEDASEDGLIAYFKFDEDTDRLHDYSGNGVGASLHELVNQGTDTPDWSVSNDSIADVSEYFEERDDESGESNSALHLNNDACLILDTDALLNGLKNRTEMTVEMQVKLDETDSGQNWLFYAAPNGNPAGWARQYLGLAFTGQELVAQRYNSGGGTAVAGREGRVAASSGINDGTWYTVRVVYKVSSMALYVNGNRVAEGSAPNKLADYFNNNSAIWFGHSGWTDNSNFNGYIDNIKIYNYANYDGLDIGPINEEQYIITEDEGVVDKPPKTTVNMFDYWITGQTDNDYNPLLDQNTFLNSGINANHLFLFAGANGTAGSFSDDKNVVGTWNDYGEGKYHAQSEPYSGIVSNVLDDGYPKLAINKLIDDERTDGIPSELMDRNTDEKKEESLAYLFDPEQPNAGKAAYPDVSGLFRFGEEGDGDYEGYYYFRSNETFAELNTRQGDGAKTSIDGNHITLYKEPWMVDDLGQFFPFNDGSDLFYVRDSSGALVQAHSGLGGQSTTSEPMNHYFGMTVETKFTQPTDGLLHYYNEPWHMTFDFSGDDDVWIFIDGVLVGDLGGLHNRVRITIDYATGEIVYRGKLASNGIDGDILGGGFSGITLHDIFENAGRDTGDWNAVENNDGEDYILFPNGSEHTLKFFYLERGNNLSNCSIRFNLHDYPDVPPTTPPEDEEPTTPPEENPPGNEDPDNPTPPNPPKKDKPKNPRTGQPPEENPPADQPPEEEQAVYLSAGQDVAATPSAEQPQAEESEAKILGVLGSPNTGDSNMTGLWLTLLVFSSAGLVAIHYRTRKR